MSPTEEKLNCTSVTESNAPIRTPEASINRNFFIYGHDSTYMKTRKKRHILKKCWNSDFLIIAIKSERFLEGRDSSEEQLALAVGTNDLKD